MSSAREGAQPWLGDPAEWGISPSKLNELSAELDDHLQCLQADEGQRAVASVRANLAQPASRRRLAAPHLTDQVYATLNRWPTRREWRELLFLLACFAVILLSDWLALEANSAFRSFRTWSMGYEEPLPSYVVALISSAWVLQAMARAAFYAGFVYTLWRAYKLGWGVMLARVLQLKLIHTVLVVTALLLLGNALWNSYPYGYGYPINWPTWLCAPTLLAIGLVLAAGVSIIRRGRWWPVAVGIALTVLFMYPGGPLPVDDVRIARPAGGGPDMLANYSGESIDYYEYYAETIPGMYTKREGVRPLYECHIKFWAGISDYERLGVHSVAGPVVFAGGGLGWLAVPIPFLGLIGLIGLVVIMGRRGPAEFALYSTICLLAIISTILPFIYERTLSEIFELSAQGVMLSPLPAFEDLLTWYTLDWSWFTLVGGLVLSAGVPWLLTGLFLRPRRSTLPPVDAPVAE